MRIPTDASPGIQQAFRELWEQVDTLTGNKNLDLKGKRLINAGASKDPDDYVTRRELDRVQAATKAASTDATLSLDTVTVASLLTLLGRLRLARFTDGSAHHGLIFVDSAGFAQVAISGDDAFTYNLVDARIELGKNLTLYFLTRGGIRATAVGELHVVGVDGTTLATLKAATLEATTFTLDGRHPYTPTNVTPLRTGDFSNPLTDIESILGTLILDLQSAGLLG